MSSRSVVDEALERHPDEVQKIVEFFGKSTSDLTQAPAVDVLGPYYGRLLVAPPLCNASVQMAATIAPGDARTTYLRELADVVVGSFYASREVLTNHLSSAVAAGIPIQTIEALWRKERESIAADDRPWVDFIESTITGEPIAIPEEGASWSERQRVEYVGFIILVQSTTCMIKFLGIAGPDEKGFEELLAAHR